MRWSATEPSAPRRRRIWAACALVAATLAVWSFGLAGPYQFDDHATPLDDPASQSLQAWVAHLPVTLRPVTKLTYALEADAVDSPGAALRRSTSIVLHAAAAVVLFFLLTRLAPRLGASGAALAAALWAVHPVHAESVLAASGRPAVLAALFLLGALLALEAGRGWLATPLFVLACLSRETAVAGVLALAVSIASRPAEPARRRWRRAAPLLAGAGAALLWMLATPRYRDLAEFSFLGRPFWKSVYAQVGAVPVGLGLLVRPWRLSIDYGVPLPTDPSDALFLSGLALYLVAAAGVVFLARRSRAAAIGVALWLAALLPTQSVVPKLDPLTNRPLSLALAGLLVVAAAVMARAPRSVATRWPAAAAATGAAALVISLAASTAQRGALYGSEVALWGDAASKSVANARPHLQYARFLERDGLRREAWDAISAARAIDPWSTQIAVLWKAYRPEEVNP